MRFLQDVSTSLCLCLCQCPRPLSNPCLFLKGLISSLSLYVYLFLCLFSSPSFYLLVCLPVYLSIFLRPSFSHSVPVCLSLSLSVFISLHLYFPVSSQEGLRVQSSNLPMNALLL